MTGAAPRLGGARSGAPIVPADLGFSEGPAPDVLLGHGMTLRFRSGWTVLTAPAADATARRPESVLVGQLGLPALWKTVPRPGVDRADGGRKAARAPRMERVFHLPPGVLPVGENADPLSAPDAIRELLEWALATAGGREVPGWTAPAAAVASDLLGGASEDGGAPAVLTVAAGRSARQATLVREEARLALECVVLPAIPGDLSPARRAALESLLTDAHRRWPLVRVGLRGGPGGESAVAEVDLSGAPPSALERLLAAAADALRWVVAWVVRSAELVVDAGRTLLSVDGLPLPEARA